MARTPADEALIAAVGEQIKNAPPCYPRGPAPTLEDIHQSFRRLREEIPARLAELRRRMEASNDDRHHDQKDAGQLRIGMRRMSQLLARQRTEGADDDSREGYEHTRRVAEQQARRGQRFERVLIACVWISIPALLALVLWHYRSLLGW